MRHSPLVYGGDLPPQIRDSTATSNTIKVIGAIDTASDMNPPTIMSAQTTSAHTIVIKTHEPIMGGVTADDFLVLAIPYLLLLYIRYCHNYNS